MGIRSKIKRIIFSTQQLKDSVEHQGVYLDLKSDYISDGMRQQILQAYETAEVQLLKKHLKPDDKVLELGMGIGFLGIFSKKIGKVTTFTGVEADENLIPLIENNARENGVELNIIAGAAGNEDGEVKFNLSENFWSNSVLTRKDTRDSKVVKLLSYNSIIEQAAFKPDFILMDIEGGELEINFDQYCQHTNRLLIELHPHIYGTEKASTVINEIFGAGMLLQDYQENVYLFQKK